MNTSDFAQECKEEALELNTVAHTCDVVLRSPEAEGSKEFKASLSYVMSSRLTLAV